MLNIAFDAASSGGNTGQASLTVAHTCTGTNRILFTFVHSRDFSSDQVTGITYAGVAMTKINEVEQGTQQGVLYYLINPASGANNIIVTMSGAANGIQAASASYTGVATSGIPDASDTTTQSSGATIVCTVTTVLDNCWGVMGAWNNDSSPAAGSGTTERAETSNCAIYDNNSAKTPPGSLTLTATNVGGEAVALMASFPPGEESVTGDIQGYFNV
jgi:hypothetical protein